MPTSPLNAPAEEANTIAAAWRASVAAAVATPLRLMLPGTDKDLSIAVLAEFIRATLKAGQTLLLVVPNDEWLPELSNALDLALRPLCLILPGPGFATGIALRATLSLLNSRLSRGADDGCRYAWDQQRKRLEQQSGLWQAALAWSSAGTPASACPAALGELFPVCVLAGSQVESLVSAPRDILLLLQAEKLSLMLPQLLERGGCIVLLQDAVPGTGGRLVRIDEETRLKLELEILAQELGEMELEFATVQAELAEFSRDYHARVGSRMIELDALQARIARCYAERLAADTAARERAEQAEAKAQHSEHEHRRFSELDRDNEKPFAPSTDLKRLFRQLAQKIHPDRATDESDRAWRSNLMSEANRAYRAGDEMVLYDILSQWQAGHPGDAAAKETAAPPQGLAHPIARMQRRLTEIEADLNRLIASRLYELFAAANLARQRSRDLLLEMAEQLDGQIAAARIRLEQFEIV